VLADDRPAQPTGLRRVADGDADALIALIVAAYDEHPGCVLDLPGVDDDLPAPGTTASRRGSPWWVVEREGAPIASVGAGTRSPAGTVELKRLYVDRSYRGHGLATALVRLVERHAAGLGAHTVELWSDSRFTAAHHRYATLGYERTGEDRDLHDPSATTEHRFVRSIAPATPDATVVWEGPSGRELAHLTALPDGWSLTSHLAERDLRLDVEVDADWATRRADVDLAGARTRLTSDGAGTWWRGGTEAGDLAGASDVDVEGSSATNTLPIRRLLASGTEDAELTAAWVRVPGGSVEPLHQRYTRTGPRTWRYRSSSGFGADLTVDDHGLVERYGDLWVRA
jgi:GNAT superfamily N-acetyltransferase